MRVDSRVGLVSAAGACLSDGALFRSECEALWRRGAR